MSALDSSDLSLLYKRLVILPQDKINSEFESKKKTVPKAEIEENERITESTNSKVAEPASDYGKTKSIPFAILTLPELKTSYLKEGSSFSKIVKALKIEQCVNHMYTDWATELDLSQTSVIWSIGLSPEEQQLIKAKCEANCLFSPDVEQLTTNEQKRAMFEPLKEFVAANEIVLSDL